MVIFKKPLRGTGTRGLMRCFTTLSQGKPGAFSGQIQDWKTPADLGVSKSVECETIPFGALTLSSNRKGVRPVKSCVLICWW